MEWVVIVFGLLFLVTIFGTVADFVLRESDPLPLKHHDGGRRMAGYKELTGDCVTRAIAIATGYSYDSVFDVVDNAGRRSGYKNNNASNGVNGYVTSALMEVFGGTFHSVPVGTFLRPGVLPPGTHIAALSEHVVAVIDGVAYDNHENPYKQVLQGYWTFPSNRRTHNEY